MKKVVLSVSAMLFVGAIGFAQENSQDTYQLGDHQQSSVTQDGMQNAAVVRQGVLPNTSISSSWNESTIKQKGELNRSWVSQNNFSNLADQKQIGNSNSAVIWQDQVAGAPNATKGNDNAYQTQTGNNNTAVIDQGTAGNWRPTGAAGSGSPSATAYDQTAPTLASVKTNFTVDQQGFIDAVTSNSGTPTDALVTPHESNTATQNQKGNYNVAYASQGGTNNESTQIQNSGTASEGEGNKSVHLQYGNHNKAWSSQTGTSHIDNMGQIGKYNTSNLTQTGNNQASLVFQKGNSNTSNVTQSN
ncbi:hypothetical protein [Flavobacterium agrisoli]|uniref:Curlin associated repeat-containing protein n=1 Tax=Flavobacterium agrisoli TaxID=2793066 RepID=A0A934PLT9_9FLAO|nr:hypothetical protein [Flavobacterium agrisoli]MBK0369170.1 hypothetical protein [Flavobacterium agrisoli]